MLLTLKESSQVFVWMYCLLLFVHLPPQGMAENGCLTAAPNLLRRDVLTGAAAIYHDLYANSDSSLPLTFNVLYFIAWKQSAVQGKPKPRGSQDASIADLGKMFGDGETPKEGN